MTITHRQAPGWWPSLIALTCDRCGASWTVDLNNTRWTAESFIRQQEAQHEEECAA